MALKSILILSCVLVTLRADSFYQNLYGEPNINLRRSKRHMTTICVEIKPSGPQEEPYFMCKGADLLNGANNGEAGNYGNAPTQPALQPNYGGNNFQNPGNDNVRPVYAKPSATQSESYSSPYANGQVAPNYNEPFENKPDGYATPNQPETSPKQNQPSYNPFSKVMNNFQVPTNFPSFKSFFPTSSKTSTYLPSNPSPAYESIYDKQDEQSGPEPTQPSATYGNNNKNKPSSNQESAYENTPNSYATSKSGYGSSYNNGGEGNQQTQSGNVGPSASTASGGQQQQPSNSPYGLNVYDARVAATPPATTSQPYGDPTLSYAGPAGPQRPASQYATGPGPASAAAAYVAPTASKPSLPQSTKGYMSPPMSINRPQTSLQNYGGTVVGAPREQQQLPMPSSRHRAMLDEDVLDMPDIGFTRKEMRQFQRTPQQRAMLRVPDRNSFQQPLVGSPTPRSGVRISVSEPMPTPRRSAFPTQQMVSQARAYYDDPIIRTFYGLDEPTNQFPSENLVGQAYPIYPAQPSNPLQNQQQQQQQPPNEYQQQTDYNQQQPDYSPQSNDYQQPGDYPNQQPLDEYKQPNLNQQPNYNQPPAQPPQPVQPAQPMQYVQPTPVLYNSYGPRPDDPMGCFPPSLQKPPQQCFAGSDNGPIYTPPSTPSSCSMDYNIQPVFIAIPCYGQPPQPQAQMLSTPMFAAPPPSAPNPIVGGPLGFGGPFGGLGGGPLGFGLFHPFGLGGLKPFGGLLGASAQNELAQPNPSSLGAPNPLGRFNLSKMFTAEPEAQEEIISEAPRRTSSSRKPNLLNFSKDVPQLKTNKQDDEESAENANADTSQEEADDAGATAKQTETIVGASPTTPATLNTTAGHDAKKATQDDTSIFNDSKPSSDEQAEADLSAKSLLDLAEAKLEKTTNNNETRSGDVRKRHNVKPFTGVQKRKYLQKL